MIAAVLLTAAVMGASPEENPHLNRAIEQVQRLEEKAALQTLEEARRWPGNTPEVLARVYLYTGLAHAGLADEQNAVKSFVTALKLQRDLQLPPHMSPTVVEWWRLAQERVPRPAEPPSPPVAAAPAAAVATPPVPASRPGVTGADLRRWGGYGLAAVGMAAMAAGAYSGLRAQSLANQAQSEPFAAPAQRLQQDANASARTANLLLVGGGIVAGAGAALWVSGTF